VLVGGNDGGGWRRGVVIMYFVYAVLSLQQIIYVEEDFEIFLKFLKWQDLN
jgi:hypothetical protein